METAPTLDDFFIEYRRKEKNRPTVLHRKGCDGVKQGSLSLAYGLDDLDGVQECSCLGPDGYKQAHGAATDLMNQRIAREEAIQREEDEAVAPWLPVLYFAQALYPEAYLDGKLTGTGAGTWIPVLHLQHSGGYIELHPDAHVYNLSSDTVRSANDAHLLASLAKLLQEYRP